MATTATSVYLAQHLQLFPAPLHVRKKSRKARLWFTQRKPTRGRACSPSGPLDDIIDEITGNIWSSPPYDTCEWPTTVTEAFLWTLPPRPVSRTPSDQPLAVRKTRSTHNNSRWTASGSTFSDAMASSRSANSKELPKPQAKPKGGPVDPEHTPAEQQLSAVLEGVGSSSKPSRPQTLRKRFFSLSNSMEKLRLKTNDPAKKESTSPSSSPVTESPHGPALATPRAMEYNEAADDDVPSTEGVAAWMKKNGHRASMIGAVCSQVAEKYPSPHDFRQELPSISDSAAGSYTSASVLAAGVRIIPETKILSTEEEQTFWIAVEVEGVQHNRRALADQSIDVVFLIDNAYHVTADCLNRACDLAMGALYDLKKSDRVALYTTHCTHEVVTGTVPEMWYPLEKADNVAAEIFREMASDIRTLGAQAWKWPRPNPPMTEVIIAVTKSLEAKDPKKARTHIVLLSPLARDMHDVSKAYPWVHVHQINPAVLPYTRDQDPEELVCMEDCCGNITVNNVTHYQSGPDRIRQIFRYARSEKPLGSMCNVHVDLRRGPGCEVLRYEGSRTLQHLRLGQVHTFFAEIKVVRSQTKELDLDSHDPVRDSTLSANNLMQDLKNAVALGASKVHLLSVQLMHQGSMLPSNQWAFTESPLLILKELGRLSMPTDRALDIYKRRFFATLVNLDVDAAITETTHLSAIAKLDLKDAASKVLDHMRKELDLHKAIVAYEQTSRKNLPLCPGPISVPYAHSFLVEKWEARKKKRMGMIAA